MSIYKNLKQRVSLCLSRDNYRHTLLWLMALSALLIFAGMGLRSPWPADEPRFAEVARAMVDNGQWLIPSRGGEYYPDKPPIFMWAIAAFYWLLGDLKLAFLLPNAIAGLIMVFLVFDLGSRLWSVRVGRNAVLLMLLAPQFLIQVKNAQIDALLALWTTLACYGLLRHFFERSNWRWYFAAWFFMGIGVITKGVGFLPALLLIPVGAYALADKQRFDKRFGWPALLGPVAFFAALALWGVPMLLYVKSQGTMEAFAYRDNILFRQTAERYVNSLGHVKPWHYFLTGVIPGLWFPLSLLIFVYWRELYRKTINDNRIGTLLAWVLLVILFFSISPGKRGVYLLPALPMLALSFSAALTGAGCKAWFERLIKSLQLLVGISVVAIGVLAFFKHPKVLGALHRYPEIFNRLDVFGIVLVAVGLWWVSSLFLVRSHSALVKMGAAFAGTWLVVGLVINPLLDPVRTPRELMLNVAETIGDEGQLGLINFSEQFILFSPVSVTHFSYLAPVQEQERNAWLWMNEADDRFLLVAEETPLNCFETAKGQHVGRAHRREWLLLSKTEVLPGCPKPLHERQYFTEKPGRWMHE